MSSPVATSTSINYNWQENQNNTSSLYTNNSNTSVGFGTHITGSSNGANGFDATQSGNPSLFTYDNTSQTWQFIDNTNTNMLQPGGAYRLMVRGDRSIDMNTNAPSPTNTILRTTGSLKIGTHTVSDLSTTANAFNFVGNPYQSPVDIETVLTNSSNVNPNYYYVWDPKVGGTNGRGAYVTYSFLTNDNNVAGSFVNAYLQPMQACFVKTNLSGAASVVFQENNKFLTTNEAVYRQATTLPLLKLNLYDPISLNQNNTALDGLVLIFGPNFSDGLDAFDSEKFTNLDENLAVVVENKLQSIATFTEAIASTIYPISLTNYKQQNYIFKAQLDNYNGLTPYLLDSFLNSITAINNEMHYPFSISQSQPLSLNSNRFKIVFSNSVLSIDENELTPYISIYPNPSSNGTFNCSLPMQIGEIEIKVYNELGQQINVKQTNTGTSSVLCTASSYISPGVYHILITTATGTVVNKKWIVK